MFNKYLNQNNTYVKNFEIGQNRYGGIYLIQERPIWNRVYLEKDRERYLAKSKPHGDMAASIFDWLIGKELNMQWMELGILT